MEIVYAREPVESLTPAGSRLITVRVKSATENGKALNIGDGLFLFAGWKDGYVLEEKLAEAIRGLQ